MALRASDIVEAPLARSASADGAGAIMVEAVAGEPVVLPSGRFLSDASYLQQGDDLLLVGPDGTSYVVRGYFLLDNPPDLISPDGGRMTAALVESFTPPQAAGQYAQLGDQLAQAAQPIGQVGDVAGQAFAVRADGTRVALTAGDPVFQGDVIETGEGSAINLLFVDETTFALGDSARLALDEMVYNPATQQGNSAFSILKGVFVFTSGQIAQTDNTKMTVTTPVATIGIRGTKVAGDVKPPGEESKFTVIDGEIAIVTGGGTVVMGDQNATTTVTSFLAPPTQPVTLSQAEVNANYGSASNAQGGLTPPSNTGGGQQGGQSEGGSEGDSDSEGGGEGGQEAAAGDAGGEGEGRALGAGEGEGEAEGEGGGEGDAEGDAEGEGDAGIEPAAGGEGDGEGGGEGGGDNFSLTGGDAGLDDGGESSVGFGTGGIGGLTGPDSSTGGDDGGGGGDDGNDDDVVIEPEPEPDPDPIVTITGTDGDDPNLAPLAGNEGLRHEIDGGAGNDNIRGGDRGDVLIGGAGNDSVNGGIGDDQIIAANGQGNDTYDGGSGFDTIFFSSAVEGVTVNLNGGFANGVDIDNDGLSNFEQVIGGQGDDTITGSNNAGSGGAVPDALRSFEFTNSFGDELGGGAITSGGGTLGSTTYTLDANNQGPVLSGPGVSTTYSIELEFTLNNTEGFRKLIDFDDLVLDEGLYNLDGNLNFFNEVTGSGNPIVQGASTHVVLTRDGETDQVTGFVNGTQAFSFTDTNGFAIVGGTLHFLVDDFDTGQGESTTGIVDRIRIFDTVLSAGEVSALNGGALPANLDNTGDTLFGADGNDIIDGLNGDDVLSGDAGDDVIDGGNGNDVLAGGDGNDTLTGGAGQDIVGGGAGDDTIIVATAGEGDTFDGGAGIDTFDNSTGSGFFDVTIDLAAGTATRSGTAALADELIGIENAITGAGDDSLTGDDNANTLDGGAGSDTLIGGAGDDTLVFRGDNVTTDGGIGNDTLLVNVGDSVVDFGAANAPQDIEIVDLAAGTSTVTVQSADILDRTENGTLIVIGDSSNTLSSETPWVDSGTVTIGENTFTQFTADGAILLLDTQMLLTTTTGNFNGSVDDLWSTGGNWLPNLAQPADGDVAILNSASNTVIYDAAAGNSSLDEIQGDDTLIIAGGTLSLDNFANTETNYDGDVIITGSGFGGDDQIFLGGNFTIDNGSNADLVGSGDITVQGLTTLGGTVTLADGILTPAGQVQFLDGLDLTATGTGSINALSGSISDATNATVNIATSFSNQGQFTALNSDFTVDSLTNGSTAQLNVEAIGIGSTSFFTANSGLTNSGDLSLFASTGGEGFANVDFSVLAGFLTNGSGATIALDSDLNGTNTVSADLLNNGLVSIVGAGDNIFDGQSLRLNTGASLEIGAGASTTFRNGHELDLAGGAIDAIGGAVNLTFDNSTITLNDDFTAGTDLTFAFNNGGLIQGPHVFTNLGAFDVNSNVTVNDSTLNFADGAIDVLDSFALTVNNGVVVVGNDTQAAGTGSVVVASNSTLEIAAGESFDFGAGTVDLILENGATVAGGGTGTNSGQIDFLNDTLTVETAFLNEGTTGVLNFIDSVVDFNGGFTNAAGATVTVDGQTVATAVRFGTDITNDGTIQLKETGAPQVTFGSSNGSTLTNNADFDLLEGFSRIDGVFSNSASGIITQDSTAATSSVIFTNDLLNAGFINITQGGTATVNSFFRVSDTASLTNQVGGQILVDGGGGNQTDLISNIDNQGLITVDTVNDVVFRSADLGGSGQMSNSGTLSVAGNGNLRIGNSGLGTVTLTNTGQIDLGTNATLTLQETTADLNAGTDLQTATGAVLNVENNAALNFNVDHTNLAGRTISLDSGGAIGGTGTLTNQGNLNSANDTLTIDNFVDNQATGIIDLAGNTTLTGSGTLRNAADVTLEGETIDLTFVQTGAAGTALLSNNIVVGGALVFEAGSNVDEDLNDFIVSGTGTIDNATGLTLNFDQFATANITNRSGGFINLNGGTLSQIDTAGLVDNQAGGLINANSPQSSIDLTGGGVIQNDGQINVTGFGDSLTVIDGELQNSGGIDIAFGASLDIQGGTLSMLNGGTLTGAGSVTLASEFNVGAGVDFTLANGDPSLELTNADITGTGTFTNDSDITLTTGGTITVGDFANVGDVLFEAGDFEIGAGVNFANNAGGTLTLDSDAGASEVIAKSNIVNNGVFQLTGDNNNTTRLSLDDNSTITNNAGGTILVNGADNFAKSIGFAPGGTNIALQNDGLISVASSTFQTVGAALDVTNNGVIEIATGAALANAATITNSASGTIDLNGGRLSANTGQVTNDGLLITDTGTLAFNNGVFLQNSDVTFGTGSQVDFGSGNGTLGGTGTVTFDTGSTLEFDGSGVLAAVAVANSGGTVSTNNNIFTVDGELTLNSGATFNLAGANSLLGSGVFDNRQDVTLNAETIGATFQQTVGTATLAGVNTTVDGTLTASGTGAIESQFSGAILGGAGVLDIQSSGTFDSDSIGIATIDVSGNLLLRGDMSVTSSQITNSGIVNDFTGGDGGPIFALGTGTLSNTGTLDIGNFGRLNFTTGTYINQASGVIDGGVNRDFNISTGIFTNLGTLNLGAGDLNIRNNGVMNQDVDENFISGARINIGDFSTAGTLAGSGLIGLDAGAEMIFNSGGVLAADTFNSGTISTNNNAFNVDGTLTLESAGTMTFANNLLDGSGVYFSNDTAFFNSTTISASATYIQNADTFSTGAGGFVNDGLFQFNAGAAPNGGIASISGTGTVDNLGALTLGDTVISQTKFINSGNLIANGTGSSITAPTVTNTAGGTITVDGINDELSFNLSGGTLNNLGTINIDNQGFFSISNGVLDNNADINVGINSTFLTAVAGVGLQNDGNFVTDSSITLNFDGGVSTNAGTLVLNNTSAFDFRVSGGKLENSGRIDINNGGEGLNVNATGGDGTLHNLAAGTITVDSTGTISTGAGAVFQDDGTTIFGGSPGSLTINGDYSRGGTSFMEMELGGLAAGVHDGFDQLTVDGTMSAGGTMQVTEFGTFDVSVGDSFAVVQADAIESSFDAIDGLDVGGSVVLDAVQSADAITLIAKAVTHQGDAGDNTLTGSAGADVISAGDGNDTIAGGGGADLMHGGDGDDVFTVSDTGFGRLDGGGGTDLVTFDGAGQSFDLTLLRGDQLSGIEQIDFGGFGDNVLTLDGRIAFAATGGVNSLTGAEHSLLIDGDAGDTLNAVGDWNNTGTVTIGGEGYTVYQSTDNDAQIFVDDDIAVTAA